MIKNFDEQYICRKISEAGKNFIDIISSNFRITMKIIKDLKAKLSDFKECLEFTEDVIEKTLENRN